MSQKFSGACSLAFALCRAASTPISLALVAPLAISIDYAQAAETAPLQLQDAFDRAAAFDPGLRAAGAGVEAAEGGLRQARARPNPTLGIETENFGGKNDLRNFNGAETTFSVSQEVEFGGKRRARIRLAERALSGAELDRVLRGLDLFRDVQLAYFEALAAEENASIDRERVATAEEVAKAVSRRVNAARDPVMASARAEAGVAAARIEATRSAANAANARAKLAAFWGGDQTFDLSTTENGLPRAVDHEHPLVDDSNPDLARLSASRDMASAAVVLEKSLAYQNPTISMGYRRFEERSGDGAFVAGVTVPIGVFDRNQGAIAKARAEERRAGFDLEAARLNLMREFAGLQRALASDAVAVSSLEKDVIPQAAKALSLARDGYGRGAFSYLDVLDAQRALSEARLQRVEALKSYHSNEAALDRLTARFAVASKEKQQ